MGLGLQNPLHILLIVVVVLMVFGAKRLPELGRSLGQGIREFKGSIGGDGDEPSLPSETSIAQPSASHVEGTPVASTPPASATVHREHPAEDAAAR